jgi:hypothetical protein
MQRHLSTVQTALATAVRGIYHRGRMIFASLCMACPWYPSWKPPLLAAQPVAMARRTGTRSKEQGHSGRRISRCRHRKSARRCQLCFPQSLGFSVEHIFQCRHGLGRGMALRNQPNRHAPMAFKANAVLYSASVDGTIPTYGVEGTVFGLRSYGGRRGQRHFFTTVISPSPFGITAFFTHWTMVNGFLNKMWLI